MEIWLISIAIVVAILFLSFLLLKINSYLRTKAYNAFLRVEKLYTSGHGDQKMEECIEYVISTLNSISVIGPVITIFLNEKNMKKILQKFFDEIKDFLDDGKVGN